MTTKKDGPDKDEARPAEAAGTKKPYATIELRATEIKDPKPAAGAGATSVPPAGAKPGEKAADPKATEPKTPDAAGPGSKAPEAKTPVSAGPASKAGDTKPTDPRTTDQKASVKPSSAGGTPAGGTTSAAPQSPTGGGGAAGSPPPAKTSAQPPRSSGGGIGSFLSHLAAGIAGGFLALLGADTLAPQMAELGLPIGARATSPQTAELQKRLAALEASGRAQPQGGADVAQKLAAAEAKLARIDEIGRSVAALADAQAKLAADGKALADKSAQAAPADEAVARVAKLEDRLAAMAAASQNDPAAGRVPQLAAITGKVADLESTLNAQLASIRKSVAEQVESRVALVAEGAEAAKSGTQRMDRDVSVLKTEAAKLSTRMEALKADGDRLAETLRVVQGETGGLKSALDGFKGDVEAQIKALAKPADVAAAVAPVAGKIAALETGLQSVVKSEQDRKANAERIVLSLELANLKRVLDRGQRYAAELAEVKKAAQGRVDLASLERYKDQGVQTAADLGREFRPVANAILDAESEPQNAGVVDRLISGAKSVVRVRKVGHKPDDMSAEAIIGRMETALKESRLGDVVAEAKSLPAKASAPAQDWLSKVEARATVDKALASIEAQLKTSLAGAPADKATK